MIWSRPTCDINGIWGGYTGDGFKTVLPSQASAKLSFRLVGTQDPEAIRRAFRHYLESRLPDGFSVAYRTEKGAVASRMSIAGYFKDILGMDAMLIGFGRDDDQIHSPNEKYDMESFHKGTRSWARILGALTR